MREESSIDSNVPSLDPFEKSSLIYSLKGRVKLLRAKRSIFKEALSQAQIPLAPNEVLSTDEVINPPSFFRRTPHDIVQEIRGILCGNFAIYEKLSIINTPKAPVKRTKEEFAALYPEFVKFAKEEFDILVSESITRDKDPGLT